MRSTLVPLLTFGIILMQSCSKPANPIQRISTDSVSVQVPHQKHRLITHVYSPDGSFSQPYINYDSLGRITSFNNGDFKVFYKNDTIHHILGPRSSFNSLFSRTSWIFQYRQDKKCYRVLSKHIDSYNDAEFLDSNPYWSDETNASDYTLYSLVYNATGQLIEIWRPGNIVSKFVYDNDSAPAPSRINDYIDLDHDGIPEYIKYHTSLTYTDMDQPGNSQLWFFPFIDFNIPASPSTPATPSQYFIVLLKKAVRQYIFGDDQGYLYISPNFEYSYDSDSSHFYGVCNPPDMSAAFAYQFTNQ